MPDNSTSNKRIAKNTIFLYIRMFFVLIVSLFTTRIVLQALGVIDYGIYNVVAGFVSMFAFLNTSMSNGIQRFYNFQMGRNDTGNITKVYNTALQIQALIALILLILLETFGLWYINYQMIIPADRLNAAQWIFQFSVLSLIIIVIQVPYSAAIMAHEKMQFYSYISIVEVIAKLAIAYLLLIVKDDKLVIYGLLSLIVTIIIFTANFAYAKIKFRDLKFRLFWDKDYLKPMLSFSGWNIFGSFAYLLKGQGLNLLLNAFFGPVVNAARGISNMVMNAIQGFQSNIVIAFRPQIVQSYAAQDINRVTNLFYSLSKISFIMLALLSIPVMIEIKYILNLWLGSTVPEYTYSFTVLILINMLISSLNTPMSQVVHATGKMKNYQLTTSLIICSILPISWLTLKLGGNPDSVFIVSLIMSAINQGVCMVLLKRIFQYNIIDYCKKVLIPCMVFSIIVLCVSSIPVLLMHASLLRFAAVSILSVMTSCIVAYYLIFTKQEQSIVISFVKKIIAHH